jgi:hypothetical protein
VNVHLWVIFPFLISYWKSSSHKKMNVACTYLLLSYCRFVLFIRLRAQWIPRNNLSYILRLSMFMHGVKVLMIRAVLVLRMAESGTRCESRNMKYIQYNGDVNLQCIYCLLADFHISDSIWIYPKQSGLQRNSLWYVIIFFSCFLPSLWKLHLCLISTS